MINENYPCVLEHGRGRRVDMRIFFYMWDIPEVSLRGSDAVSLQHGLTCASEKGISDHFNEIFNHFCPIIYCKYMSL